jgi:hypothetical protein
VVYQSHSFEIGIRLIENAAGDGKEASAVVGVDCYPLLGGGRNESTRTFPRLQHASYFPPVVTDLAINTSA